MKGQALSSHVISLPLTRNAMRIRSRHLSVLTVLLFLIASPAFAQVGGDSEPGYDEVVKQKLDSEGWTYEIDGDGDFRMIISFSDEDRSQLVYVISNTYGDDIEVREIWAPVYKTEDGTSIPGDIASWALESSWDLIIGSLASNGDTVYLVAKIDADASASVLSDVIRTVASSADELEKEQETGSTRDKL